MSFLSEMLIILYGFEMDFCKLISDNTRKKILRRRNTLHTQKIGVFRIFIFKHCKGEIGTIFQHIICI